ncbi:MAG TPA: hypothetical protein VMT82_09780 [candidate division Zixibacteria bacterium]|nr:hypothetical protein [candidate division Zixibacteria bacterium]
MRLSLISLVVLCFVVTAFAQQEYVGKYDAYTGFTYATVPSLNLIQRGFHTQGGRNVNRWLSMGLDYSLFTGHASLTPSHLSTKEQNQIGAFAASQNIPPSVVAGLQLPYDATTNTVAGGPQIAIRHFKRVTFLLHPGLGLVHQTASAKPAGALQEGVVSFLQSTGQLNSSAKKSDTTYFLGVGGGFELNASKHVHLRFTTDYIRAPLFDGFLKETVSVLRFSVGPTFNFGKNVVAAK